MADFCKQCSDDTFGEDFKELANLSKVEDSLAGVFAVVICEGCGPTQVDHLGNCISPYCLEKGHP